MPKNISFPTKKVGEPNAPRLTASVVRSINPFLTSSCCARAISKARLWPVNLGAGKPYEEDLDSRLEDYLEAVIFRKTKDKEKAKNKLAEVARDLTTERHTINDLLTALALKQSNRANEGEKLLKEWLEKQPKNKMAQWAYEVYHGNISDIPGEADENWRILKEVVNLDD